MFGFKPDKLRRTCNICSIRINFVLKSLMNDEANLEIELENYLEKGMYEEAKIRVDSLIATANKKKALMMLKTYAERIRDAAPSLKGVKELPEDLFLPACTMLYAARLVSREVQEMDEIANIIKSNFGKSMGKQFGAGGFVPDLMRGQYCEHADKVVVSALRRDPPTDEERFTVLKVVATRRAVLIQEEKMSVVVLGRRVSETNQEKPFAVCPDVPKDSSRNSPSAGYQSEFREHNHDHSPSHGKMHGRPTWHNDAHLNQDDDEGGPKPKSSMEAKSGRERKTSGNSSTAARQQEGPRSSGKAEAPASTQDGWGPMSPNVTRGGDFGKKLDNAGGYTKYKIGQTPAIRGTIADHSQPTPAAQQFYDNSQQTMSDGARNPATLEPLSQSDIDSIII